MKLFLPLLALVLIVVWIVARVTVAVTGAFLHLLWIIALIMLLIWIVGLFRSK